MKMTSSVMLILFIVHLAKLVHAQQPQNVTVEKDPDNPHSKAIISWFPPKNENATATSEMVYCVNYCVKPKEHCKTEYSKAGQTKMAIADLEDRQLFEISVAVNKNGNCSYTKYIEHTTDESGLKTWHLALIVIAGVIFLVIVLSIVVFLHFKAKYSTKSYRKKGKLVQ